MNNDNKINGANILFFSQYFFGYEEKIKNKMLELGANVDMYDERSIQSAPERALLKINKALFRAKTKKYYDDIFERIKDRVYDYILFIDCEMAPIDTLEKYKTHFKHAKLCLHMWDSVRNLKNIESKFYLFDYITTFDPDDAKRYSLNFRPLFFCDDYYCMNKNHLSTTKYKLSFIGTVHSDRYRIINKIKVQLPSEDMYVYPYIQGKFVYWLYRFTKRDFFKTKVNDFVFTKLSSTDISKIVESSMCVLDIQHPRQSGLTMRTLEMVGMRKKTITTNADIVNYDFYNPNNIMVIDRKCPIIEKNFLNSEYEDINPKTYEYYHISNWIQGVLGIYG